ncbi:MAG: hypothetical protein AAF493_22560 [Pseudomonadota bacterium]
MRPTIRSVLCGGLLALSASLVPTKDLVAAGDVRSPVEVATEFIQHARKGDWLRSTSLFHPDAQQMFRDLLLDVFQDPDNEKFRIEIFGDLPVDELAALSPAEFAGAVTQKLLVRQILLDFIGKIAVVGEVREDENAHVLVRSVRPPPAITQLTWTVITLKPNAEGQWRVMLSEGVERQLRAIRIRTLWF